MHWITPQTGYPKVAAALKDSGSAAFYCNLSPDPQADWSRAIDAVYHELGLQNPDRTVTVDWLTGVICENFRASGCFGEVVVRQYAWSVTYTAERFWLSEPLPQAELRLISARAQEEEAYQQE